MGDGDDGGGGGTSNNVYIKDKDLAWIPARLIDTKGDKATVSIPQYNTEEEILSDNGKGATGWKEATVNLKEYTANTLPLQNTDEKGMLKQVDDMIDLAYLHEAAILYNLKDRHLKEKPYTRTGDIIIAINPYQWLTHIYTGEQQAHYSNVLVWEKCEDDPRRRVEPHVYESSSLCYKGLAVDRQNQSILVSGESGAGKTETVKICMNHMASVQRGPVDAKSAEKFESPVVMRVVDSNPLLEAFGNAKTRRNDNSSRFGKYIMLQFDRDESDKTKAVPVCKLAGSKCEVYLLEKSRVVFHEDVERTYHVFYEIINAPDAQKCEFWKEMKGVRNESFAYVGPTDFDTIEKKKDGDRFIDTCTNLGKVGVAGEKLAHLMRAICAVLQLGNLTFGPKGGDSDTSQCTAKKEIDALAKLLDVTTNDMELGLTERTIVTRGETYKVPLNAETAKDTADAFAKEIYARLFLWLVRAVNDATCAELNFDGDRKQTFGVIGLLDIFGFESFPINGFEQLSINYANEKLQQKFTQDIFRAVQEEYKFEGIDLADIVYDDNSNILALIEGKGGLVTMLNEECVRPKGSDAGFVNKVVTTHKKTKALHHGPRMGPLDFGIHHYAGTVQYFAKDFVQRNTDTLPQDLQDLAKKTSNEIIAKHLQNDAMINGQEAAPEADSGGKAPKRGKSSLVGNTVWTKFKTQLTSLMTNLNTTRSRYIRCVKPNTYKAPRAMLNMTTMDQLRCAGVVAAITVSRSAFPNRLDHQDVIERFKLLGKRGKQSKDGPSDDPKTECAELLARVMAPLAEKSEKVPYAMGKTRAYFRAGSIEFLEGERAKIWDTFAVDIQRVIRGWWGRHQANLLKYAHLIQNAIPIQAWWRGFMAKKEAEKRREHQKWLKKQKKKQKKAVMRIQEQARCWLTRRKFLRELESRKAELKMIRELDNLQQNIDDAEKVHKKALEEKIQKEQEQEEDVKEKIRAELKAEMAKNKKKSKQSDAVEESQKIIEYLRSENQKLRGSTDAMRKDFRSMKSNNQRLMEANASASASFTALNNHAKQLNDVNTKLQSNVATYKKQLGKMKDDLKLRQNYYMAEANARMIYSKTMRRIVCDIKDQCSDSDLVEEIIGMATQCEHDAKSDRLDAARGVSPEEAKAKAAATTSKKAAAAAGSDSDSDSD